MFKVLPWFIQKEIISYTVFQDRIYSIINKEWFNASAGQFIELNDRNLSSERTPSGWCKLAETLTLATKCDLNWDILQDCTQIKQVQLEFHRESLLNFKRLESFLAKLDSLKTLILIYESNSYVQVFNLLKIVGDKLQTLIIINPKSKIDLKQDLEISLPNLIELNINSPSITLDFNKVHKLMPKVNHFSLVMSYLSIQSVSSLLKPNFSFIKVLKIDRFNPAIDDQTIKYDYKSLFNFCYPLLEFLEVYMSLSVSELENIPVCMPKLKKLSLVFFSGDDLKIEYYRLREEELEFPTFSMPLLEEFEFFHVNARSSDLAIKLNLALVPELVKLESNNSFHLFNTSKQHRPLITNLIFKADFFPYSKTCRLLPNLKEVTLEFRNTYDNFFQALDLFNYAQKLRIKSYKIPSVLDNRGSPPYKTIFLELILNDLDDTELLEWIAGQTQLEHLSLRISGYRYFNKINPVVFPYLQRLDLWSKYREFEAEMRSKLTIGPIQQ